MRMKSFVVDLGKTRLYTYDDEKDANFLDAAPHMTWAAEPEDVRRRDEFVSAVKKELKGFEAYPPVCSPYAVNTENQKFTDQLRFGFDMGIVHFANKETGESFSLAYDNFSKKVWMKGWLTADNCENLDRAFKEYGKGLENTNLLKSVNFGFDKDFAYLNPLLKALEKEGVIVADMKGERRNECLRLKVKNDLNVCLDIPLRHISKDFDRLPPKKSRAVVIRDIKEKIGGMNPLEEVRWVVRQMTRDFDRVMKENKRFLLEVERADDLKKRVSKVFERDLDKDGKPALTARDRSKANGKDRSDGIGNSL